MKVTMYGIPNCDSVKKARSLLDELGIAFSFHDYKKQGAPEAELRAWVKTAGRDVVLNRKGTTWRALDGSVKASVIDDDSAIAVMLANPSTIKRPVVVKGDALVVGFDEAALRGL